SYQITASPRAPQAHLGDPCTPVFNMSGTMAATVFMGGRDRLRYAPADPAMTKWREIEFKRSRAPRPFRQGRGAARPPRTSRAGYLSRRRSRASLRAAEWSAVWRVP